MKIKLPKVINKSIANEIHIETQIERESHNLFDLVESQDQELQKSYNELVDDVLSTEREPEIYGYINSMRRSVVNVARTLIKLSSITDEMSSRYKDVLKSKKTKIPLLATPANAIIDLNEMRTNHFARGMNGYKLVLLFLMGSFIGVIVETLWCLLRYGVLQSRVGLVYGPFNALYGLGVMVLSYSLYNFRNRGRWLSFLGGAFYGSLLEYMCSFFQELLIGSRSWDYSQMPFNINGRICLLYSIFWGILGVVWMKEIYPRTAELILKLPNKFGKIFTWCVFIFFVFDVTFSGVVVYRWSARINDNTPPSRVWKFIDDRFPNERMEKLFPSMEFGSSEKRQDSTEHSQSLDIDNQNGSEEISPASNVPDRNVVVSSVDFIKNVSP